MAESKGIKIVAKNSKAYHDYFIEDTYERWCTVVNPNKKKTVVIPYVSAYGYTKQIAEKIEEGIKASGDIDVRSYDMVTADQAKTAVI